jgi:hypothetical protein
MSENLVCESSIDFSLAQRKIIRKGTYGMVTASFILYKIIYSMDIELNHGFGVHIS